MQELIIGLAVIGAAIAFFLLFVYNGGVFQKKTNASQNPSSSASTNTGVSSVGAGARAVAVGPTISKGLPSGGPLPLQGVTGVSVPVSSKSGGTNPYASSSTLFLGVGAAGIEQPWGPGPGSGPFVSPPTSPSRSPTAVNAGTVADSAPVLSTATHPNMTSGPSGLYSSLQGTLGGLRTKPATA